MKIKNYHIVSILLISGILLLTAGSADAQDMTVHFLAVGHGDAIFIEFPEGQTMLIDGGTEEMGRSICNYIEDRGYQTLDYVVLTHTHPDHIGGLIKVMENFEIEEIWLCPYLENYDLVQRFEQGYKSRSIRAIDVMRGNTFAIDRVNIRIINPPFGSSLERLNGPNGASVAMKMTYGETSFLLMADVDSDTDQILTRENGDFIKANVLKCGHHGSGSSSSEVLLKAVSADIAVVSTGPSEWGYPSERTMARIAKYSGKVFRTDEVGTIVIASNGKNIEIIQPN